LKLPTEFAISIATMLVGNSWWCYFGCSNSIAKISHTFIGLLTFTEHSGYFEMKTDFVKHAKSTKGEIEFYDSNTGKLLYSAPRGRSMDEFLKESKAHGWPSFRDAEVSI
jgi:hypothetical protein